MPEAYIVILCNSYSMNKYRQLVRRLAVSSPGRRLHGRLARFAAVSRQGAPCSKSTRLPDPAASPHQFLHDRSEYKVLKVCLRHSYDSSWHAIRACINAVTTYLVPQLLFAAEPGQRKSRYASAPYHCG